MSVKGSPLFFFRLLRRWRSVVWRKIYGYKRDLFPTGIVVQAVLLHEWQRRWHFSLPADLQAAECTVSLATVGAGSAVGPTDTCSESF